MVRKEIQFSEEGEFPKQGYNRMKNKTEQDRAEKSVINILQQKELNFRNIALTPNGKYLLTCSEYPQNELPKIIIWNTSEVLEGGRKPFAVLEGKLTESTLIKVTNWFLCVDSTTFEIEGQEWWVVVAGNIIGEIYIWNGKVNEISKEWDFKENSRKIINKKNNNFSKYPKAIMDFRIRENREENVLILYFASNNIHAVGRSETNDNTLNQLTLTISSDGQINSNGVQVLTTLEEWISTLDLNRKKDYIALGTRNGQVFKWNLEETSKVPILIGEHEDYITCVKIFHKTGKIASSGFDNKIRIWKDNETNKPDLEIELLGHKKPVLGLDLQTDNKYLISTSDDNTIKIWDLEKKNWIRNIDIDYLTKIYLNREFSTFTSKRYLKRVIISSDNRYLYFTFDNMIIVLKNFGIVYQFEEQLKFIKDYDQELFTKIYGVNLLQIAENIPESSDSLFMLYETVKKRLRKSRIKSTTYNLQLKGQDLGTLFVPAFIEFEIDKKFQKEYIIGVKENYDSYWKGIQNLFYKIPDEPWQFKLYITTDDEEDIKKAKFVEITDPKLDESAYLIMKDRNQTLTRFLMVLENVPTAFVPLIKNIKLNVEDDRGDNEKLVFSDFAYSPNFVRVLSDPKNSIEKFRNISEPKTIFYAFSTFQLEGGYNTEKFANIYVRNITVDFSEDLEPLEDNIKVFEEMEYFGAFKKNFQYPLIPKTQIKIGKGIVSAIGKLIDDYFAKIIVVEFILSLWGYIQTALQELFPNLEILVLISNIVSISTISLIIIIFLMMIVKKK